MQFTGLEEYTSYAVTVGVRQQFLGIYRWLYNDTEFSTLAAGTFILIN